MVFSKTNKFRNLIFSYILGLYDPKYNFSVGGHYSRWFLHFVTHPICNSKMQVNLSFINLNIFIFTYIIKYIYSILVHKTSGICTLLVCLFLSFPIHLGCILIFLMVIIINGVIFILDFIWGFKKCIILEPSKATLLESSLLSFTWVFTPIQDT